MQNKILTARGKFKTPEHNAVKVVEHREVKVVSRAKPVDVHENCAICGRRLTTQRSIEIGVGPECEKRAESYGFSRMVDKDGKQVKQAKLLNK